MSDHHATVGREKTPLRMKKPLADPAPGGRLSDMNRYREFHHFAEIVYLGLSKCDLFQHSISTTYFLLGLDSLRKETQYQKREIEGPGPGKYIEINSIHLTKTKLYVVCAVLYVLVN